MKTTLGVAAALATMALMAPAPASAQQVSCPVKIGGILPLTGSMAPITKKIAESAQLALEHINQGGGIKGCPVELVLRDDQGQPTVGVDAAKYLVEVERVPAITGTISLFATPIAAAFGCAGLASGPKILKTVGTPNCFLAAAAKRIAG
jgi:branched-chain amino acid transport system substrate-binding protein